MQYFQISLDPYDGSVTDFNMSARLAVLRTLGRRRGLEPVPHQAGSGRRPLRRRAHLEIRRRAHLRDRFVLRDCPRQSMTRTDGARGHRRRRLSQMTCPCRASPSLAWLAFVAPLHAATEPEPPPKRLELQINGLKPALESAVLSGLTLQQYRDRSVSDAQLRRLLSSGETEIRGTLEAWGYYDGKVSSHMEQAPEGRYRAWFDVTPGEPILVRSQRSQRVRRRGAGSRPWPRPWKPSCPSWANASITPSTKPSKDAIVTALADNGYLRRQTHRTSRRGDNRPRTRRASSSHGTAVRVTPSAPPRFTGGQFSEEFLLAVSAVEGRRRLLQRRRARPAAPPGRRRLFRNRHRHAASGQGRGPCRTRRRWN